MGLGVLVCVTPDGASNGPSAGSESVGLAVVVCVSSAPAAGTEFVACGSGEGAEVMVNVGNMVTVPLLDVATPCERALVGAALAWLSAAGRDLFLGALTV